MSKHKKKSTGPAWAHSSAAAQPRAQKPPSTPFDRACADLAAAMQRVMRASARDCYGDGAELALDLGPREPRQPERRGHLGESSEPVLTAFGSKLEVEGPARIIARCVCDDEERLWVVIAAVGPHAAPLARSWWRHLDEDEQIELPPFTHTIYLSASIVAPHEAPPETRRVQPYCALRFEGREYFVLATSIESDRRGNRATLTELEVLTSIADLLARAGESEEFEVLAEDDPSREMTRLAFVDGGAGGLGIEWGPVARPAAPEDDEDALLDSDGDGDYDGPSWCWAQVDADVREELIDQATRLELAEELGASEGPRRTTVVLIESPTQDELEDDLDDALANELQLPERFLAILDTSTLEQLVLAPLDERTVPGAVRQVLGFFEDQGGCRLPHELSVEDDDLYDAFSELLDHERRAVDLPVVEVGYSSAGDAASRFVKAGLAHALCLAAEQLERETPTRTPSARAEAAEARDFALLGAAEAYLEFLSEHAHAARSQAFSSFVFPGAGAESQVRRDELELEELHFECGQLAHRVLAALGGDDGQGSGWLTEALERGAVLPSVAEPLRALLSTAPDLYLVRAKGDEFATLESLTTRAVASMRLTILTPPAEPGEVVPLRRWAFGESALWLPAGKELPRSDAEGLLERLRAQLGGVDADAMRSAAATILRATFERA